jgi:transcriptional regulator GlxA family with amidase domain
LTVGQDRHDVGLCATADEAHDGTMATVVFVAYEGFQLLDLAGPLEVLRSATLLGADPDYETVVVTPGGAPVRSESGVQVAADASLADVVADDGPIDTLVVVGGLGHAAAARDEALVAAVRTLAGRARRTAAVCTGALVVAAAGLLDGHRATTHWAFCDDLARRHPAVDVLPDRIYVHDRHRWTSAGVTAGTDLFLALVDDDHGPALAHEIAGWLVVFVRRPGGQHQFSAQLTAQAAVSPTIAELQRWLPEHLADDLTIETMARRAHMSTRTFTRAFRSETGTTPAAHVEALRVEAARRLLETTDLTVAAVAAAVGLRRAETLHRAFRRRMGTTPDAYRQHFALRAS